MAAKHLYDKSIKNYSKFYKYNYDSCYIDYKTNKLNYFFYLRKYYKKSKRNGINSISFILLIFHDFFS